MAINSDGKIVSSRKIKEIKLTSLSAIEEEKAEPQDESEIMCCYHEELKSCPGPMGDERSYVIKNGKLVMAHKDCQKRSEEGKKKTPSVIIR